MSDFRTRMFLEYEELQERVRKLHDFFPTAVFAQLPQIDQDDLREQFQHMGAYLVVLGRRVSRQCGAA